jgi:5'-3' exonuclease
MDQSRAYLIDASIYIFRAWFSLPDQWHTVDGWPLNAVYGYTKFLLEFLESRSPTHCAAAFDESLGTCFRNDIFPAYKASRELPDESLAFQLRTCREITEVLGIPCFGGERFEADDYLATLAHHYREEGIAVTIMTRDKDLGQIIRDEHDQWWDYSGGVLLDRDSFTEKYGVTPEQFADYQALVGDPVDDIPGVPGVGAKTATALLRAFGDLESLHRGLDQVSGLAVRGASRLGARLAEHWPAVETSRALTGLVEQVPDVEGAPRPAISPAAAANLADYLVAINLEGPLTRRCAALAENLSATL